MRQAGGRAEWRPACRSGSRQVAQIRVRAFVPPFQRSRSGFPQKNTMAIEDDVLAMISTMLARPGVPVPERLADVHRLLAKLRSEVLGATLSQGGRVHRGPFEGMEFPAGWTDGTYLPKLLGIYERELQPVVSGFSAGGYRTVINAGCAEGYYAVGLARRLPGAAIHAFDIDPRARERCADLAGRNGVEDRVRVGAVVDPASLEGHPGPVLLVCDIEGAEGDLLDPAKAPALRSMDVLVEVHDVFVEGTGRMLETRFAGTHRIRRILSGQCDQPELPELAGRDQLDQLLARWEGRIEGTYWLWMESGPRDGTT